MMLYLVLCSFSTPYGKYFSKLNQHQSLRRLYSDWLASIHEGIAGIQAIGEALS